MALHALVIGASGPHAAIASRSLVINFTSLSSAVGAPSAPGPGVKVSHRPMIEDDGSEMVRAPDSTDPRVARALQVIDVQPPGGEYPGKAMTLASGLSIGRLNRLCAQLYGFTTHQYWERARLERARLALKADTQSIKEVAYGLGFLQLSHFSAWFKRHEGASPRAFRTKQSR